MVLLLMRSKKKNLKFFSKFKMFDKNYFKKKMMELKWLEQLVSFLKSLKDNR